MSDFVGVVADYIELEGVRLASSPADLLRLFGGAPRRMSEQQLSALEREITSETGLKKESARRRLQRWGYVSVEQKAGKQARGPLTKARGGISKKVQDELRRILLRRRDAPTRITISGTVYYRSGDNEKRQSGTYRVEPVGEAALLDILKVAEVSTASTSGVEPPMGGGERGEAAATNVLTGFWFGVDAEDITIDGKVVAKLPYHPVIRYGDDVIFRIQRLSAGRVGGRGAA